MLRLVSVFVLSTLMQPSQATCPPTGYDTGHLTALRDRTFTLDDDTERNALALALLDCLSTPDPTLRDGIAFEALSTWLRGAKIAADTRTRMFDALLPMLEPVADDEAGFRRPFAALVLSEVARTDRVAPWLDAVQRETLVAAATRYLASVDDYRGFDDREGWRHGVAHGADLLLQLVLNPALDAAQIDRILTSVAKQIAPAGAHFYVFGEPERLARPVLYAAQRGTRNAEQWHAWFAAIAAPAPLPDWRAAFRSRAGLAQRHNVRAFLSAIYITARDDDDPNVSMLAPMALAALREIP